MIISKQFLKSIPQQSKDTVLKKLESFQQVLMESEGMIREIPAGYWIRKVKNTDVYKFRLNNSDRILFTFLPNRDNAKGSSNLLFLKYVTHDKQIRDAHNLSLPDPYGAYFELDQSPFKEERIDEEINKGAGEEYYGNLNDIPAIVVEDDYLAIIGGENNEDYLYYLSDEQYAPLQSFGKPMIISGAGGTGKTAVLLNKLFSLAKEDIHTAYFSYTDLLVDDTKRLFQKYSHSRSSTDFFSIKRFYAEHCHIQVEQIVTYFDFLEWLKEVRYKHRSIKHLDELSIWTEIKGIIKGYLGLEYTEALSLTEESFTRLLPFDQYLQLPKGYSPFSPKEKEGIYKLTLEYQKWLMENSMYDENDLAVAIIQRIHGNKIKPYDFLIVDEVQDLSETQLYMVSKLVKNQANIIFGGDVHQTINPTFFHFGRVKNLYFTFNLDVQDFILTKNYRNTKEIIDLTNKLSSYRQRLIGKTPYDYDAKGVRTGPTPSIMDTSKENLMQILEVIKDKHYAAIIVADEEDKNDLVKKCKEAEGRIFTVYEIKGLEYETIFCYNIISKHYAWWEKMFKGEGKRKDQFRYYINLFYVAISRAKDSLFILEPKWKELPEDLLKECTFRQKADKEALPIFKASTTKDWEKEAERLEKTGNKEKSRVARDFSKEQKILQLNQLIDGRYMDPGMNHPKVDLNIGRKNKYLKDGIKYLRLQRYTQSIQSLNTFIEEFPDHPDGYYYLGLVYSYAASGTDYAISFFNEALKLKPSWYEAYLDKAASLRFLAEPKEALETLGLAIRVNPKIGNAYFIKGMILFDDGRVKEAETCFKKALKLPCYSFDSVNKVWNPNPPSKEEQAFKNNIKMHLNRCLTAKQSEPPPVKELQDLVAFLHKSYEEISSTIENTKNMDVVDYSLLVLDEDQRSIISCREGETPLNTAYSSSTKKFVVQFAVDVCKQCEKYPVCPMNGANSKGELKIKKKQLFS
ncbi:tetratricopeptide (TPR) repeat protein [Evansella vedderi]|uniref:Tetratricopeptide (TPR) repeat protein n=1 Tax=Evansella vedderi TaxID=38282 RepID=A0ABT9ZNG5_9BACI|nr:UvrD-helicase domain-containing protein [Evansella vedderi]MDQ0252767.1 tetratricopeptide (TPR) repeat protein [Evansella vedderi]